MQWRSKAERIPLRKLPRRRRWSTSILMIINPLEPRHRLSRKVARVQCDERLTDTKLNSIRWLIHRIVKRIHEKKNELSNDKTLKIIKIIQRNK